MLLLVGCYTKLSIKLPFQRGLSYCYLRFTDVYLLIVNPIINLTIKAC